MTVISTVFSKNRIVVASDGYITSDEGQIISYDTTKFVKFDNINCVVSFWGLAITPGWSLKEWLERQNRYLIKHPERCHNLEDLAHYLSTELSKLRTGNGVLANFRDRGIGLHVAGFEVINDGLRSPELFLVTNYSMDNDGYYFVQQDSLDCTRRTIADFVSKDLQHLTVTEKKQHVYDTILNKGSVIIFNNGDPVMFNSFATPIKRARKNGKLKTFDDEDLLKKFAAWPIEKVKEFQQDFYAEGKVVVGGIITTKILTADGEWY